MRRPRWRRFSSATRQAFEAFERRASWRTPSSRRICGSTSPGSMRVTWARSPASRVSTGACPEVIDAWFDSGSMPFAQWGYPHRGCRGVRGELSCRLHLRGDRPDPRLVQFAALDVDAPLSRSGRCPIPTRTCMVLGHVADREGKKESKSKGNYTPPDVILDRVRARVRGGRSGARAPVVSPEPASIAREDYEGLDLRGESTRFASIAPTRQESALELELRRAARVTCRVASSRSVRRIARRTRTW